MEGWQYLRTARPLAAWASWNRALRVDPQNEAARQALDSLEHSTQLPSIARGPHRFRGPQDEASRKSWGQQFQAGQLEELVQAHAAFLALVRQNPQDSSARYNLALCQAWLGRNRQALAELDHVIQIDSAISETREFAVEASMLCEILRQGAGAEDQADDMNCTMEVVWPGDWDDPETWFESRALLQPVVLNHSLDDEAPADNGTEIYDWLDEKSPSEQETDGSTGVSRILASMIRLPNSIRIVTPSLPNILRVEALFDTWLGDDLEIIDRKSTPLPIELMDLAAWRFHIPEDQETEARWNSTRKALDAYYLGEWLELPRRGLAATFADKPMTPTAAASISDASAPVVLAKLEGILRVREQLLRRPGAMRLHGGYALDAVRVRLGLEPLDHHE
jgi:hypothetical protein